MTYPFKRMSPSREHGSATAEPHVHSPGFSTISSPSRARTVASDLIHSWGSSPAPAIFFLTMVATGSTLIDGLRYRVPLLVLLRMIVNMGLDSLIGSIPLVGDAFDFLFKANRRNVALLENAIADGNQAKMSAKRYFIVVGVLVVLAFVAVVALIIWLIAFIVGQIGWF